VIVAVGRRRQTLCARDRELEDGDAAICIFSRDQEAHSERAETDGLVGRIHVEITDLGVICVSFRMLRSPGNRGTPDSGLAFPSRWK